MLTYQEKMITSNRCLFALPFFLLMGLAASNLISDSVFESRGSNGRNLLQVQKSCSVDFESANYTIITSNCMGPQYLPDLCCAAFKEFACPYVDAITDPTNNCAAIMFSYINVKGKYPPGLFSSVCQEGKEGLLCNATAPAPAGSVDTDTNGGWVAQALSPYLIFTALLQVLLFQIS